MKTTVFVLLLFVSCQLYTMEINEKTQGIKKGSFLSQSLPALSSIQHKTDHNATNKEIEKKYYQELKNLCGTYKNEPNKTLKEDVYNKIENTFEKLNEIKSASYQNSASKIYEVTPEFQEVCTDIRACRKQRSEQNLQFYAIDHKITNKVKLKKNSIKLETELIKKDRSEDWELVYVPGPHYSLHKNPSSPKKEIHSYGLKSKIRAKWISLKTKFKNL